MRVPTAPRPNQHTVLSLFRMLAILIGVYCYLTVVSICISLIAYDVEHLFICYLPSVYLFGEVSVKVFGSYFNGVVCSLFVEF